MYQENADNDRIEANVPASLASLLASLLSNFFIVDGTGYDYMDYARGEAVAKVEEGGST